VVPKKFPGREMTGERRTYRKGEYARENGDPVPARQVHEKKTLQRLILRRTKGGESGIKDEKPRREKMCPGSASLSLVEVSGGGR